VLVHEPIDALRARTAARVSLRVIAETERLLQALRGLGHHPSVEDGAVELSLPGAEQATPDLLRQLLESGLNVYECRILRPTLEDLFLQIVRDAPTSSSGARA
jgi:ABC-2 type transport system ATP-binding protein